MSLTITIPGAVEATTGAVAPAILTIGVGTPGATGPAGPAGAAGVGVPAGGTAGQFLTKIDGTNYNTDWTTVNLSAYAPLASPAFTGDPTAPTATFGDNDTSISTTAFVQAALAGGTAVAKNLEVYVRNQSGSTITAGSIVYISGATGNRPLITLAQANNDANSAQTIGFVKTSIANNDFGNVIIRGELEDLDTSALTEGAQLYLSPTTAGTWTTTKPSAPQHLVYVGIVLRSHPTQGTILVAVQNGYELGEIHDVALSSPANLDLLTYESSTDLWKNKSFSTLGLLTSADAASTYQTISGMSSYLTTASAASTYQTLSGMSSYLTTSAAASTYYLQTNPSGFITSSALSGYATESWVTSQGYASLNATELTAISSPEIKNYGAGAIGTMTWSGNLITFTDLSSPNPDGGQVSFTSDSVYSYYRTGANWNIHYPYGTGQTVNDLITWINGSAAPPFGLTAALTSGTGTDSIDGIDMSTSNALLIPTHTLTSGDTFTISGSFRDYLTKFYRDTVSTAFTYPYLAYDTPTGQAKWWDLNNFGFISASSPSIGVRFYANAGLTVSGANLVASSGAALSGAVTLGSNATATTQTSTDSSTLVATTAFVKSYKPAGTLLNTRYFTTVGSSAYSPTTGTNYVVVEVLAGGGGSNGFDATSAAYHSGGGGSGGYGRKKITTGFSGVTITVGAAGTAGTSGTLTGAGNGGSSSFGTALTCTGGSAGGATTVITVGASTSGAAGTATGSDLTYVCMAGSTSGLNAYASGQGGHGAMGLGYAGFPGVASSASTQTIIAQSSYGYGSGASGHARGAAAAGAIGGTAGRQGIVIVHEYS